MKSHEIYAKALDPVPELRKRNAFMKEIKYTQLQDDYRVIKDDAKYQNSTAFYNKMNENYRIIIEQKIIKPVSIFKRKINHMNCVNGGGSGDQGGHGRGQLWRPILRKMQKKRQRTRKTGGQGQGGRSDCGRGRYNGNKCNNSPVDLS